MRADYVIVGAGSAGCVLANRLTEDPETRVVLIEAGGRDRNPLIHIPAGIIKLLDHPTLTWGFRTEADPSTAGRSIPYPRGRVLGGSSSINGIVYVRGQPEDFDHWAQLGNRGWSWDDVLPFFKKAENWQGEANEVRGTGGPLPTIATPERPPLCLAAIEAGQQIGLEYRKDVNDLSHDAGGGIGWFQQTRRGRRRASTATSYLRPAMKRANLEVITHALVHRVLFDGIRAIGVEYSRGGEVRRIDASKEVILAAGAIGSPHILQLSGVGDPEHLGRVGIPVHHQLPGVGKNFQDHFLTRVTCAVTGIETLNEKARGLALVREAFRYAVMGNGLLTYGAFLIAASVKVLEEFATPDLQCQFAAASFVAAPQLWFDSKPGMTAAVFPMRPLSRGFVEARSNMPGEPPLINPRYLSEERDRRIAIAGLRWVRRLMAAPALARYVAAETSPGRDVQTDDELLDYVRRTMFTAYHASCSCKMGADGMAVVDQRLRVHGLERLRVMDASVMPTVTSTNTNAPTIMIAEKGAAMLREEGAGLAR